MREFWQVGKKHWNWSSSFCAQLLIHKPSLNRPIWHLVTSSSTLPSTHRTGSAQTRGLFFSFLCACDFALFIHILEVLSCFLFICGAKVQWLNNESVYLQHYSNICSIYFQAKRSLLKLLKCEDLMIFFVINDSKLIIFVFWTVGWKFWMDDILTHLLALENHNGHFFTIF